LTGGSLLSYVALAPGAARGECLLTALALLGAPVRDHRRVVTADPCAEVEGLGESERWIAWPQLERRGETPGMLVHGASWEPELLRALTAAAGGFGAARTHDHATREHGFAAAYAGVRLEERYARRGSLAAGEADAGEFADFVEAASGLPRLRFSTPERVPTDIVTYAHGQTGWSGPRQLARMVLVQPRGQVEPLAERLLAGGWTWQASAPGGVEHGLLQREGPGDPELARMLATELGCDVTAVSCADGGAVRWLHTRAAGREAAGEGRGWRAAAAAWARPST
jgi:hypothetical protein